MRSILAEFLRSYSNGGKEFSKPLISVLLILSGVAAYFFLLFSGFFDEYNHAALIHTQIYFRIFCVAMCIAFELALIAWLRQWKLPLGQRLEKLSTVISALILIALPVFLGDILATQANVSYTAQHGSYSRFQTMQIVGKTQLPQEQEKDLYYLDLKDQSQRVTRIKVSESIYHRTHADGWLQFRYKSSKTGYYLRPRDILILKAQIE